MRLRVFGWRLLSLLALAMSLPVCGTDKAAYEVGPAPTWVQEIAPPDATKDSGPKPKSDAEYLLVDRQARLDANAALYYRFVVRVLNPTGVQNESQLSIEFDPEREHLQVHSVTVRRGTQTINELKQGRIEVIQRESELERGVLDGALTFHLVMADIRVGDTIDYSYSIERAEPEWDNRFFQTYMQSWSVPVGQSHLRVIARSAVPLTYRETDGSPPKIHVEGDWRSLEWSRRDVPAVADESEIPSWFPHHARVEFTQFKDWREVAQAEQLLFQGTSPGPQATKLIDRYLSPDLSEADRALAILRFVQEDIRYTGVELGEGAYRPSDPETVLERRWGDCKDKAMLAVTLLRGVGIDAAPALVNTRRGAHLGEALPSPGAFNHAIVRARIAGSTYWLDVTQTAQGSRLDTLSQADYGAALVVGPQTSDLEQIPQDLAAEALETSTSTFDLSKGYDQPAALTVSTLYRRSRAEDMRQQLRGTRADDLAKDYLNYYSDRYPGIKGSAALQVHDDPDANELTVVETYQINRPFSVRKNRETKYLEFEAESITSLLRAPKTPVRSTPLALSFPSHVVQQIRIELPRPIPMKDARLNIRSGVFEYESSATESAHEIVLEYRYQAFGDAVPVDQLRDYLAKRQDARDDCFFTIDVPVSQAVVNTASQQLVEAGKLLESQSWEKADIALTQLIGSEGFGDLDEAKRHAAFYLAALAALQRGDRPRGQDLLKQSSNMASATIADWRLRLQTAAGASDTLEATSALTKIAQKWPDALTDIQDWEIFRTVAGARRAVSGYYELLRALFDAKFEHTNRDLTPWWRDLALLELQRGNDTAARAALAVVTDPYAAISVQADKRFDRLRSSLGAQSNASELLRRRIASASKALDDAPNRLENSIELARVFSIGLRPKDALQVINAAVAKADGPEGHKYFADYSEHYNWLLNARSTTLLEMGLWDEALAQMRAASQLPEHGLTANVSQVINLALEYDDLQRPDDARAALLILQGRALSAYGQMQMYCAQLEAAVQLSDEPEIRRILDLMREHKGDAIATYQQALVIADRSDEAAQLLIERLQDADQRTDALISLQRYDEHAALVRPKYPQIVDERWHALAARSDVRSALDQVGRLGTYALLNPGI